MYTFIFYVHVFWGLCLIILKYFLFLMTQLVYVVFFVRRQNVYIYI